MQRLQHVSLLRLNYIIIVHSPEDKTIFQDLADMLGAELVQVIGFNGVLYKAKKEPKIILPK